MANKKEETASFVLRLSQKIYESDTGEPQIQWRGSIRHVQSGEEQRFASFDKATVFMQARLSDITLQAIKDKPEEEQKGIISMSFDFWRKVATNAPKVVLDSIKDPKKQAAQLQEQLQEQFHQIQESIGQKIEEKLGSKVEFDSWLSSPKDELNEILDTLNALTTKVDELSKQVAKLNHKKMGDAGTT